MVDGLMENLILTETTVSNKGDLLKLAAETVSKSSFLGHITPGEILEAMQEREELSSTGLGKGIAIPHCNFAGLKGFSVGLIICKDGVDFDSIDNNPARFIFFIVGPLEERNRHINILSQISRLSSDQDVMEKLLECKSAREVAQLLTGDKQEIDEQEVQKCQMIIHLQNEEIFEKVLETLSSVVAGSLVVIDSENAGGFLDYLPLLSTFWNNKNRKFCRTIMAVLDKRFLNDTVRRINMISPDDKNGILITVQDLLYVSGSIDF